MIKQIEKRDFENSSKINLTKNERDVLKRSFFAQFASVKSVKIFNFYFTTKLKKIYYISGIK